MGKRVAVSLVERGWLDYCGLHSELVLFVFGKDEDVVLFRLPSSQPP